MADNNLQVRLLHATKTHDQWTQVQAYPRRGEVCLEAINSSGATAFKIKIGDGTRPFCQNTSPEGETPVWDFTSDQVLPYFGSVIETSGTVNVVAISTYNTTKKKLSFYTLGLSASTSGGSTTITPTIASSPYLEIIEGDGVEFTTDETGTVKEFYINLAATTEDTATTITDGGTFTTITPDNNHKATKYTTFTLPSIADAIAELDTDSPLALVEYDSSTTTLSIYTISETDGVISKSSTAATTIDLSGVAPVQDVQINSTSILDNSGNANLAVDGTYNASSNKIATESTVSDAVEGLDVNGYAQAEIDTTTTSGQTTLTIKGIEEVNGEIAVDTTNNTSLVIDGTYNASTNKIATESTVSDVIATLDGNATTTDITSSHDVIVSVSETDGIVSSAKKTIVAGNKIDIDIPTTGTSIGDIIISHEDIDITATDVASTITTDTSSVIDEKELSVITGIKVDAQGHITHIDKDVSTNLVAADIKASVKTTDNSSWYYRPTAGSNNVEADIAKITALNGHTVKFNQLVQNGDFSEGTTNWSSYLCTISASNNILSATIVNSGSSTQIYQSFSSSYTSGHKYLASAVVYTPRQSIMWLTIGSGNQSYVVSKTVAADTWTTIRGFITPNFAPTEFSIYLDRGNFLQTNDVLKFTDVQLIDLTAMFGTDAEIAAALGIETSDITTDTGVAAFEAWLAQNVGYKEYYPYTEGKLISVDVDGLKTVGFNQWDEEWENCIYPNGVKTSNSNVVGCKNKIRILPNTKYFLQTPSSLYNLNDYICYYDANGEYLNLSIYNDLGRLKVPSNTEFTTPDGAYYMTISLNIVYGTTYNHDICINLSWSGYRDGEYEPYWSETLDLSWIKSLEYTPSGGTATQLFPHGLLSAGNVHDEVTGNKAIKRIGSVDLGTLEYTKFDATGNYQTFFYTANGSIIPNCAANGDINAAPTNVICSNYLPLSRNDVYYTSEAIGIDVESSGTAYLADPSKNSLTADQFKDAMSGVILYYELATPIEVDITPAKNMTYRVDDYGTEELIPNSTSTAIPPSAGFAGTFEYQSNFKDAVIDTINKVNDYKNPVRGVNNTLQTTGKVAVYDSNSTVKSSTFEISNSAIDPEGTSNETTVPTVDAVVDYVEDVIDTEVTVKDITTTDVDTSGNGGIRVTNSGTTYDVHHADINQNDTTYSTTSNELVANVVTSVIVDDFGHVKGKEVISSDKLIAADIKAPVTVTDDSMWSYRTTAKDVTIVGEDNALIDTLKGKTLKWQQLVQNGDFESTNYWSTNNATMSVVNNEGSMLVSAQNGSIYNTSRFSNTPTHKLLISLDINTSADDDKVEVYTFGGYVHFGNIVKTGWQTISEIITINSSWGGDLENNRISIRDKRASDWDEIKLRNLIVIDLTLMFGETIANSMTVEEFEALYPLDYYSYTATPVLINNAANGIVTTGFNQFDESTLENDKYLSNAGVFVDYVGRRASSVYFRCFPSTNYYFKGVEDAPYSVGVSWYNAEKNWISNSFSKANTVVQSPSNASFFRVCSSALIGNICINLSWSGYRNGEYEPYEKHTLYFNGESGSLATLTGKKIVNGQPTGESVTIFPDGLKSAGSVYDFGKADSDGYIRKVTKRIGVVDLGTLTNWQYNSEDGTFFTTDQNLTWSPLVCNKYEGVIVNPTLMSDKQISTNVWYAQHNIIIKDSSHSTVPTTQDNWVDGVIVYFALATPEEYLLDTPIPANYIVNDWGTELRIPDGVDNTTGVPLSTPFTGIVNYKSNFKDSVIQLIEKVNNYKNPVQGVNNTLQTVGKLAIYDTNHTTVSSVYFADRTSTDITGDTTTYRLPTVQQMIDYVTASQANALQYKGTVSSYNGTNSVVSKVTQDIKSGWLYFIDTQFILANDEAYLDAGTYNIGDFIVWNATNSKFNVITGVHNINNPSTLLSFTETSEETGQGHSQTVATIDGVDIVIKTPDLNLTDSSITASGNSLTYVDTVEQANGKLSATKKTIPDASTTQKGVVELSNSIESATSSSTDVPTDYETLTNLNLRDVGVGTLTNSIGTLTKRQQVNSVWESTTFYPTTKLAAIDSFTTDFATAYPDLAAIEALGSSSPTSGFPKRASDGTWSLDQNVLTKYLAPIASPGTDYTFSDPSSNDVLGNLIHDYYTGGDYTNKIVTKVKKASLTNTEGFAIDVPILSSTSATAGKVLKGVRADNNTGLPIWANLSIEELSELNNLSSNTGYLKRESSGTGYTWSLDTPVSTTVTSIHSDQTPISSSTVSAGIKVTTNGDTTYHKISVSALINDTVDTLILNGNFS